MLEKNANADMARNTIAAFLSAAPERRTNRVITYYLHQWTLDKEDL